MILEAILPALLPVAADGIRGVFNKVAGGAGAAPANVGEAVQLMDADTNRLKAIAEMDKAGNVSPWVANVRALQRPVASGLIISGYLVAVTISAPEEVVLQMGQYAQMVTFYLFGDRSYGHFKRGK
jgi:hypothetical protein